LVYCTAIRPSENVLLIQPPSTACYPSPSAYTLSRHGQSRDEHEVTSNAESFRGVLFPVQEPGNSVFHATTGKVANALASDVEALLALEDEDLEAEGEAGVEPGEEVFAARAGLTRAYHLLEASAQAAENLELGEPLLALIRVRTSYLSASKTLLLAMWMAGLMNQNWSRGP